MPARPAPERTRGVVLSGLLLTLALAVLAVLAGCGPTEVATPPTADRAACAALVDDLPDRLAGEERVEVEPAAYGAGWGDPAITLSCGVGAPDGFGPASSCLDADGVDWFAPDEQTQDNGSDVTLTTVTMRPRVAVHFPATYRGGPLAAALSDLAPALKRGLRVGTPCQ